MRRIQRGATGMSVNDVLRKRLGSKTVRKGGGPLQVDGADDGGLSIATVTLANDEVLAFEGLSRTLVPAPGPGHVLLGPPTGHGFLILDCDTTAAVYTNVNVGIVMECLLGSNGPRTNYGPLNALFAWGGRGIFPLGPTALGGNQVIGVDYADLGDQPIIADLFNQGDGDLTGGDIANSLRIHIGYFTVPY